MMEYPFKDLLPIDEVLEREGYYKDWTHLDPEVFYSLTQISEYIKTKGYGVDVRLLISQLAEHFGLRVTQITDAMNEFNDLKPKAELSVSQSAEALTKSQSVQEQFNQVVIEGDSSVEAAQARVDASGQTNPTLKARLDKEHNEVTAQLAQTSQELKETQAKPVALKHRNDYTFELDQNYSRPLVTFVSDDALIEELTHFKPLFDGYGWKFSTAVMTDYVGGLDKYDRQTMTWDEIRYMYNNGFTVLSHTKSHPRLGELSESEITEELKGSRDVLLNKGFDVRHIMYPYGSVSQTLWNTTPKYYVSGAQTTRNINYIVTPKERINRYSVAADTIATLKSALDKAITYDGWVVYYIHGYEVHKDGFMDKLRELMNYIQTTGVSVLSYDDAYDLHIRRKEVKKSSADFVIKTNRPFDTTPSTTYDILAHPFNYMANKTYGVIEHKDNKIFVQDNGTYLIDYSFLFDLETGADATVNIYTEAINKTNVVGSKVKKHANSIVGNGFNQLVNGMFTFPLDPLIYTSFSVYIEVVVNNQTVTNRIIPDGDVSRVSIIKVS